MGEYFNGVKLGTCEHLMYVRRDEVEKRAEYGEINKDQGNLKTLREYLKLNCKWIYRFPVSAEDNTPWESVTCREAFDYLTVQVPYGCVAHNEFMQTHINGVCVNLPFCIYSDKARDLGVKPINDCLCIEVKIIGQRYTPDNPQGYTIFACPFCDNWYAMTEDEINITKANLITFGRAAEAERIHHKIMVEQASA